MSDTNFVRRHRCPVCRSADHKTLYQCGFTESPLREYLKAYYSRQGYIDLDYLNGATYSLAECGHCGLIYQEEIANDELMEILYEKWIDPRIVFEQDLEYNDLSYYSAYAREIMQIIAYFDKAPDRLSFFDFGMGWGKWARMAKAFGCNAWGSELSETRIAYAKSNGVAIIHWDEIPQHRFDFINTEQVFEHIPDPLETLLYLKRALKPDGLLKIYVPDGSDVKNRLRYEDWMAPRESKRSLNAVGPLEHINCFNRDAILRLAHMADLEEVCLPLSCQYRGATDWHTSKQIARNLLTPLRRNLLRQGTYVLFGRKSRPT